MKCLSTQLQTNKDIDMEECTHKIGWFSTRFTYPPIIGKMSTCWKCGHTKAGSNTVTFAANHIEMTHGALSTTPNAGIVRIHSTGTTNLSMKNNGGTVTALTGGGATMTLEKVVAGEASTDSTSMADMSSATSLNIAATKPVMMFHVGRTDKGGASANVDFGMKVNGTNVTNERRFSYGTSDASGLIQFWMGQRLANYDRSIGGWITAAGYNNSGPHNDGTQITTDAITSLTVTGMTSAGDMMSDEFYVYTLATS